MIHEEGGRREEIGNGLLVASCSIIGIGVRSTKENVTFIHCHLALSNHRTRPIRYADMRNMLFRCDMMETLGQS